MRTTGALKQEIICLNHLFVLPDIYRKHRPKYSCGEPTFKTSHCSVHPAVPFNLWTLPMFEDGSSGMRSWVIWFGLHSAFKAARFELKPLCLAMF